MICESEREGREFSEGIERVVSMKLELESQLDDKRSRVWWFDWIEKREEIWGNKGEAVIDWICVCVSEQMIWKWQLNNLKELQSEEKVARWTGEV